MAETQLSRGAYTVGWICALHIEYTAAQEFLDEEHLPIDDDLDEGRDDNHYTLGSIGNHNIVIAVLPSGEYGTASAASVAKDLVRSFPNVRIGLMVGIGGGAPSPDNDIRLGDIVVSTPSDGHSGVFQYDFGKTIQERDFQYTRVMDQPPAVLRTAVAGLRSRYERKGHDLDLVIQDTLQKNRRLRKKYGKPDPASDLLFKSTFLHQEGNCDAVCAQDVSNVITRDPRDEDDEDEMQIHYGLIASSNSLMKDALLRDQLIRRKNVLCFEMEAAGLMNTFPCLVIRGICDYSDSHKNKVWQGYAAMAAAAYARALCLELKITSIEKESKILDVISEVREATVAVNAGVREIRSNLETQQDRRILEWLSTDNYGPQHSDVLKNRSQGTGQWLLDSDEYQQWLVGERQTLFCAGIPGAGKTVITATVIDDLIRRYGGHTNIGIAFVYCNFRRQSSQGLETLMASIARQLSSCLISVPEDVHDLYHEHHRSGTKPSNSELLGVLRNLVKPLDRAYIIVDALDECQSSDGDQTALPDTILDLQQGAKVNFFATSRHIPSIKAKFQGKLYRKIAATPEDLSTYLEENISRLPEFVRNNQDLQREIREQLITASQGMFLVARLYVHSLIDKHNVRSLKDALQRLNEKATKSRLGGKDAVLDVAYADIFERIRGQLPGFRELAERVLSWVAFGRQRLTAEGLQAMVATRVGERTFDMDNLTNVDVLISVCCGLVTLQSESNVVQLVHYTTQKYLEEHKETWLPSAYSVLANDCVTHLMYHFPEEGEGPDQHRKATHSTGFGLAAASEDVSTMENLNTYAAYYWGYHVAMAESFEAHLDAVDDFLDSEREVKHAATKLAYSPLFSKADGETLGEDLKVPESGNYACLHLAAFFGLFDRCHAILESCPEMVNGLFVSKQGRLRTDQGREFTPLHFAILGGQIDVIELLVDHGAELEETTSRHITLPPLAFACRHASLRVIETLVQKGANVDAPSKLRAYTPLHCAASVGRAPVTQFLLRMGAQPSSQDRSGVTPLMIASVCGYEDVGQLLIEAGADFEMRDDHGGTALSNAAASGESGMVTLLVKNHCSLNHLNNNGNAALDHALNLGRGDILRTLVDAGADWQKRQHDIPDFLILACVDGEYEFLEALLDKCASNVDVFERSISSTSVRSLVEVAAGRGHRDILQLLLSRAQGPPETFEPRHIEVIIEALQNNQLECVEMLALHLAAEPEKQLFPKILGYMATQPCFLTDPQAIESLIYSCPGPDFMQEILDTALLASTRRLRMTRVADSIPGGTDLALQHSVFHLEYYISIGILLKAGANFDSRDEKGWSALEYAQKYDGEDLPAFTEALGLDPFFWHVLHNNGLTWYSGMLKDYADTRKHMEVWQEDFTETLAYHLRFGDDPFKEWFIVESST